MALLSNQILNNGELQDFDYFNTMQMRPPYLKKGDLVGITAPARWVDPEDVENFMAALKKYIE